MVTIDSLPGLTLRSVFGAAGITRGGEIEGREEARESLRSGFRAVDALMPAGGLRRGSLVEWIAHRDEGGKAGGAGAVSLALAIACRLAKPALGAPSVAHAGPRTILVVDRGGWFYPPSVLPWLGDTRRLIVARPSHDDDEIWTIDQALRCGGVAAVVAWPRSIMGRTAWGGGRPAAIKAGSMSGGSRLVSPWTTAMRRWQLAARSSGAIGLFIRQASAASEPSWAEAKIAVSPLPGGTLHERRLRLERVGGAWNGGLTGRATETVLDLARGCEGAIPREAARSIVWPRYREATTDVSNDSQAGIATGGVSCRAS